MDKRSLKTKILEVINKERDEIIDIGERIYKNPETGFKEYETSKLVEETFHKLGLECTGFGNIPGIKATLDTGRKGPGVAILGELDAVVCPMHPHSSRTTGAVHACGHNLQISSVIGAAMGILGSGALDALSGKIHFIAVPAEEYIEIAYRNELREKGIIKYLGGKPEIMYRGIMDDVDMSIMVHALPSKKKFTFKSTSNGCIVKQIKYIGKASHAGGAPEEGINALYAANIGLMAVNSIRETFREDEYIRVHPIITKGGDIVNVIPCDVRAETFVRGKTIDGILKANRKVNRALLGGAIALGAKVEIEDLPGYLPLNSDKNLECVAKHVMTELVGEDEIAVKGHSTASSDLGDLSALMPVLQPYIGGVQGVLHSADYRIYDRDTAYLLGARFLACMAVELLWGDGNVGGKIVQEYKPVFESKEKYFAFIDKIFSKKLLPESDYFV